LEASGYTLANLFRNVAGENHFVLNAIHHKNNLTCGDSMPLWYNLLTEDACLEDDF